ncbi:MAG: transposase [Rubrobacteraceae bacterium]
MSPNSRDPIRTLSQRAREEGAPEKVLLDFDATDYPVHGEQEGSYYHGYYRQHMYHPLLVFDGQSGHLITALLRAGNTHASNCSVSLLKRLVFRLGHRWPADASMFVKVPRPPGVPGAIKNSGSCRSREQCNDAPICQVVPVATTAFPSTVDS